MVFFFVFTQLLELLVLLEHNFFIKVSPIPWSCNNSNNASLNTLSNSCLGLFIVCSFWVYYYYYLLFGWVSGWEFFLVVLLKSLKILVSKWAQVMKLTMSLYKCITTSITKATSRSRLPEPDCIKGIKPTTAGIMQQKDRVLTPYRTWTRAPQLDC